MNVTGITQESGAGQADQDATVAMDAAATAEQAVDADSTNGTSITQNAGDAAIFSSGYGSDNYNQDASADSTAGTEVGAAQENLSNNTLGISQVAGDGPCAHGGSGCGDQVSQGQQPD